ncbi:MAG TPA: hypothetical protein VGL94_14890 [Ktedonobacteraceae bacterium]
MKKHKQAKKHDCIRNGNPCSRRISKQVGVGGYLDRKIIAGTLQTLIDKAELFMQKYIAVRVRIEGWKRIDLSEYPIGALREAIVHRDYSREGKASAYFLSRSYQGSQPWTTFARYYC